MASFVWINASCCDCLAPIRVRVDVDVYDGSEEYTSRCLDCKQAEWDAICAEGEAEYQKYQARLDASLDVDLSNDLPF